MKLTEKEDMMYTWDYVKVMEKIAYQRGYRAGKKCREGKNQDKSNEKLKGRKFIEKI